MTTIAILLNFPGPVIEFLWTPWTLLFLALVYVIFRSQVRKSYFKDELNESKRALKYSRENTKSKTTDLEKKQAELDNVVKYLTKVRRDTVADLNSILRNLLQVEPNASKLAMFTGYIFEKVEQETANTLIKEVASLTIDEFESCLDGEHFVEIFDKTNSIYEILYKRCETAGDFFLNEIGEQFFHEKECQVRLIEEINKIFKNKKNNPLISYETLGIICESLLNHPLKKN